MPDVIGKNRHDADQSIADNGFDLSKVQVVWVASTGNVPVPGDACKVMSSDPAANTPATKTDKITLKINTGLPASDPLSTQAPATGCGP